MGAIILLLTIVIMLCAVVLCMNRTRDASSTAPSHNNGLNSRSSTIKLDFITTNISYNVPANSYNISVSSEDDYNYVQPNQFIRPSNLEDGIKMSANPSYGVSGVTDRMTAFNTTKTDSDAKPHPFSQQHDYDIAITTSDNVEEDDDTIHVDQRYTTKTIHFSYLSLITDSAKLTDKGEDNISDQSQGDDSLANQQSDSFWYTIT